MIKFSHEKSDMIVTKGENWISVEGENINYSVNMYNYNELIKVEVIVINNDKTLSESYLKLLVQEIKK